MYQLKSLFHFQTACIYTGFFWGGAFQKRQKITDHLFISTLPETNSLHLKMDKLEYFLLSFWGVWRLAYFQVPNLLLVSGSWSQLSPLPPMDQGRVLHGM